MWVDIVTRVRLMCGKSQSFRIKPGGIYSNTGLQAVRLLHVLLMEWQTECQTGMKRTLKLLYSRCYFSIIICPIEFAIVAVTLIVRSPKWLVRFQPAGGLPKNIDQIPLSCDSVTYIRPSKWVIRCILMNQTIDPYCYRMHNQVRLGYEGKVHE